MKLLVDKFTINITLSVTRRFVVLVCQSAIDRSLALYLAMSA
jgi:hypothetical protein